MKAINLAFLGQPSLPVEAAWLATWPGARVWNHRHVAPSGFRLGRRALGLGLDSAMLAARMRVQAAGRAPTLAMNPWTGVACRRLGLPDVACTGIYASPGTSSWVRLRAELGETPVVTSSEVERDGWRAAGGRAEAVRWGGTFGMSLSKAVAHGPTRIFLGGTSDRDPGVVAGLISAMPGYDGQAELHIADGSGRGGIVNGPVRRYPRLSTQQFHELMQSCHVVALPLREGRRSAGHMVLVAALEAGLPLAVTPNLGMESYLSPLRGTDLAVHYGAFDVPTLLTLAETGAAGRAALHQEWRVSFSVDSYVRRVRDALALLGWPGR